MPITVLSDVILPNSVILAGVRGKNMRNNNRSMTFNGYGAINVNWTKTLRQYSLGLVPMDVAAWQTLEGLHEVTEGGAYGFLLSDPKDQLVDATAGQMQAYGATFMGSVGFGYGMPAHRLFKRYSSAGTSRFKDRQITRPKTNSVALKRGGSPVTLGSGAGQAAINFDTGTVTFVADASQSILTHTVGSSHVLNFSNGTGIVAALAVGQRVYLSGITGTAAATLNGASHEITSKGATSLTIATNTVGLTATGGTAAKYPQADEALTWAGQFYVPVHFMDDNLEWDLVRAGNFDSRFVAGPSVVLQEVRE